MTNETITIILPLPPQCLSANRPPATIGGRMKKAAASKKYRKIAGIAARDQRVESSPWEVSEIKAVFFHTVKRRRDDVNFLSMLKAAYDGITDAGIIVDDDSEHLKTITPEFKIDKKQSRVELTLRRLV